MIIPENNNAQNTHEQPNHDEEIQNNRFIIEIQDDGNLIVKDKNGVTTQIANIRGPRGPKGLEGVQGPNGNDGQDGDSWIPSITEDGTSLIFVDNDGNRRGPYRIKGDSGERGAQGATGPKGQDADLWKPAITEDGKYLFFENQKGEHTEKYLIQGIKGDTGGEGPRGPEGPSGPVFIPSVNVDGEISWSNNGNLPNPAPINIRGSKGDTGENGAVFHPVIIDGYLTWTNDRGLPNPAPVKISGPQGITGEKGNDGRSAYQIWLDNGNLGTEKEFLESLKGEQGEAAEQISTGYLDVEEFHCPVQKINTDLIASSAAPSESPEEIIDKRIYEIEKKRKEGHTREKQKQMRVRWFKKAMWWCAGADRDLLTMCPGDHSKFVGIGTTILFTALMAVFSSFFAMRLVFDVDNTKLFEDWGNLGAFAVALVWGSMIFFLDRFITNTMYSDGKVSISKQEFLSGLPRMLIAIFIGIVIAAPLELKIFDKEVKGYLSSDYYTDKAKSLVLDDGQYKKAHDKYTSDSLFMETKRSVYDGYIMAQKNRDDKVFPKTRVRNEATGKIYQKVEKPNQPGEYDREYVGKTYKTIIDTIGFDEEACNNSIEMAEKEYHIADSLKSQAYNELCNIDSSLYSKYVEVLKDSCSGLFAHLEALHAIATWDYEPWWVSTNENGEVVISENGHPKGNFWDTILHSWWWYLLNSAIGLIMLLFILIDISPVLYKMMLADGKYDNYLHQEKLLAQDEIRLSLSKMLKKLDDSELKRVAPFIMGDIYEKMAGDSFVFKTEEEFKAELKNHSSNQETGPQNEDGSNAELENHSSNQEAGSQDEDGSNAKLKNHQHKYAIWNAIWNLWPLSWIRWLFWKEKKESNIPPVIIFNTKEPSKQETRINTVNEEVFEKVLDMKRRIILASYRRWYKRQHDNILGDRVDDENAGQGAFDDSPDNTNEEYN